MPLADILAGVDARWYSSWLAYNERTASLWTFTQKPESLAMTEPATTSEITLPPEPSPGLRLTVRTFGLTDPGRVRASNEDQFVVAELTKAMRVLSASLPQPKTQYGDERGYLFIVADGMGGHAAGEKASALAVQSIESFALNTLKWFFRLKGAEAQDVLKEFQTALQQADARIYVEAELHPELAGMGTTVTMAYSFGSRLFLVHVGDSRCYLLRKGQLHRLTHDHTLVEEMVRRGQLQPEEAAHHHLRHLITNAVGGPNPGVQVECHRIDLEADDTILLCSDGLTSMVPDDRIAAVLQADHEPRAACERLVAEANEHGGTDNITVIVARFETTQDLHPAN
jgi:serine/threonine protein phosphatase PrpC